MNTDSKLSFHVETFRLGPHGSVAHCKQAEIPLDTDLAGNPDAFNPAELLLAALSACIVKGIERVAPMLQFDLRGVEVRVDGVRQDVPPKMESITYEIIVDTDETDRRLELLHENVQKFGTVFNTVAPGTKLSGVLRRLEPSQIGPGDASPGNMRGMTTPINLPPWLPANLAHLAVEVRITKGSSLFHTGDGVSRFFFVNQGKLAAIRCMPNGAEAVMLVANGGEFFAEASLFLPSYTCDARALSDCLVTGWPVDEFRQAVFSDAAAAQAFAKTLAVSLRRQCSRVERLRMKQANDRVLHYLACEIGSDGWCELGCTLQEWAAELGLEAETLYRALAQLEKAGTIERDKRRLRINGQIGVMCATSS